MRTHPKKIKFRGAEYVLAIDQSTLDPSGPPAEISTLNRIAASLRIMSNNCAAASNVLDRMADYHVNAKVRDGFKKKDQEVIDSILDEQNGLERLFSSVINGTVKENYDTAMDGYDQLRQEFEK